MLQFIFKYSFTSQYVFIQNKKLTLNFKFIIYRKKNWIRKFFFFSTIIPLNKQIFFIDILFLKTKNFFFQCFEEIYRLSLHTYILSINKHIMFNTWGEVLKLKDFFLNFKLYYSPASYNNDLIKKEVV